MKSYNYYLFFGLLYLVFMTSCDKDDDDPITPTPDYEIPSTYNFENVSYSGQLNRLGMLSEIKTYLATSRTMGQSLDLGKMRAMYSNDAANAGWNNTYDESKQLKNKTFENQQAVFEVLLEEVAVASQSQVEGSEGQSGVMTSNDGTKSYLIGEDGLDHAQLIEKGLMGACFYYQMTAVYLSGDKMDVDNETVEPGKGTTMEHHWDEAFGYFGVPTNFPTITDGLVFWGSYSNSRNGVLGSNKATMDAFLKGRAAISAKDLETRDEAITEVRESLELISVASVIHYLNESIANFDDMALRGHLLSEAIGFAYALQFNPSKKIDNAQISNLLTLMGGAATFDDMNLYNISVSDLQEAKNLIAGFYNLEDSVDSF